MLEKTGLKISNLYIAQIKQKCGIIECENYNNPKNEDVKQPKCPLEKEKAIMSALKYFRMIQGICERDEIMPFEKGGRADKQGNRYEINCIIYEMLKVLDETNYGVIIEALGIDEIGTDILVTTFDGQKEHQQCKTRNASKEHWDISDLKSKDIFSTWKIQLNRDNNRRVSLASPMACSFLFDLHNRACNTSGKAEDFYSTQIMKSSKEFQKFYKNFCAEMDLDCDKDVDVLKSIDYLKRIFYKQISEYELKERINQNIQYLFSSEQKVVYNALLSFVVVEDILGKQITQGLLILLRDALSRRINNL